MEKVKDIAKIAAIVMLAALGAKTLWDLDRAIVETRGSIQRAGEAVARIEKDAHGIVQNTNAVLVEASLATYEVQGAAREQRAYWKVTSKETARLVTSADALVRHTDISVNGMLVPSANELLKTTSLNVDALGTMGVGSLNHFNEVSVTLRRQLDNPAIAASVSNIEKSTRATAEATGHLAKAAGDIEVKVHQMTRPAGWAVRVGSAILGFGAKVGSILAGAR